MKFLIFCSVSFIGLVLGFPGQQSNSASSFGNLEAANFETQTSDNYEESFTEESLDSSYSDFGVSEGLQFQQGNGFSTGGYDSLGNKFGIGDSTPKDISKIQNGAQNSNKNIFNNGYGTGFGVADSQQKGIPGKIQTNFELDSLPQDFSKIQNGGQNSGKNIGYGTGFGTTASQQKGMPGKVQTNFELDSLPQDFSKIQNGAQNSGKNIFNSGYGTGFGATDSQQKIMPDKTQTNFGLDSFSNQPNGLKNLIPNGLKNPGYDTSKNSFGSQNLQSTTSKVQEQFSETYGLNNGKQPFGNDQFQNVQKGISGIQKDYLPNGGQCLDTLKPFHNVGKGGVNINYLIPQQPQGSFGKFDSDDSSSEESKSDEKKKKPKKQKQHKKSKKPKCEKKSKEIGKKSRCDCKSKCGCGKK